MEKSARSCSSELTFLTALLIFVATSIFFFVVDSVTGLSNGIHASFFSMLLVIYALAGIFTYAPKHYKEKEYGKCSFEYTTRHRSYDITFLFVLTLSFTLSFFAVIDYLYGETEKPIEQLNGIYLGEYYNHRDFESDKVTIYEADEDDNYAFYTVDKEQPSLSTYVFQTEKEGVNKVVMVFRNVKHADNKELASTLEEQLINAYGGKPSFTENVLHHDNRYVEIWTHSEGVSISVYEKPSEDESEIRAQRETLSVKLRMMDALAL